MKNTMKTWPVTFAFVNYQCNKRHWKNTKIYFNTAHPQYLTIHWCMLVRNCTNLLWIQSCSIHQPKATVTIMETVSIKHLAYWMVITSPVNSKIDHNLEPILQPKSHANIKAGKVTFTSQLPSSMHVIHSGTGPAMGTVLNFMPDMWYFCQFLLDAFHSSNIQVLLKIIIHNVSVCTSKISIICSS